MKTIKKMKWTASALIVGCIFSIIATFTGNPFIQVIIVSITLLVTLFFAYKETDANLKEDELAMEKTNLAHKRVDELETLKAFDDFPNAYSTLQEMAADMRQAFSKEEIELLNRRDKLTKELYDELNRTT